MANIKLFENASFGSVRVVMRGNDPWFVAKDVCDCLALSDVSVSLSSLDDDEKYVLLGEQFSETQSLYDTSNTCIAPTVGLPDLPELANNPKGLYVISESGLYSLVMRSRKPEAKEFKRWVTHEVLPSIRKTGMYAPRTYLEALKALVVEVEAKEKAQAALLQEQTARVKVQQQLNELTAVTEQLLVKLGLAGSYLQVKGFPYIYRIATALPKDANQRFWGPIGKAVSAICRSHGGIELSPQKVATTWGQFKNRGPWDMVQFPDPQYTTIHTYPVCAMEEFKQLLISGFYDTYKFAQYFHSDFKTILSAI